MGNRASQRIRNPIYRNLIVAIIALGLLSPGALADEPVDLVAQADVQLIDETVIPGRGDPDDAHTGDLPLAITNPELFKPMPLPHAVRPAEGEESGPIGQFISRDLATGETSYGAVSESPGISGSTPGGRGAYDDGQLPDDPAAKNFGTLTHVTNTTTGRYPTAVKVYMTFEDSGGTPHYFVGSGTLIDPQHVLTAGHCVFDNEDSYGWATSITVVPAYDDPSWPYGSATATSIHSWTGWTSDANWDYDVGYIGLSRPVGALTGWRGYGYHNDPDYFTTWTWVHNGYPAETPYNGLDMYTQSGDFDDTETLLGIWTGNNVSFDRRSYGGSSGSGAVKDDVVRAVLSSGTTTWTQDARINSSMYTTIGATITTHKPLSLDMVPLNCQASSTVAAGSRLGLFNFLVHNYSSGAGSGSYTFDVYLSTNDNISTADALIGSYSFSNSFTPLSSVRVNFGTPPLIPAATTAGNYWIGVIITSTDAIYANNDTDGWDAAPISVTCPYPSTATLYSPSNAATCQGTSGTLDWSTVSTATSYQVQIGTSCGAGSTYTTSTSSYSYSGLSAGTRYYWRVRARNACGNYGAWTGCRYFTVAPAPPAVPVLVAPANGANCQSTSVTVDWNGVSGATSYQVQLGTSCGVGTIYSTTSTARTYSGLTAGTTYYWRVRAATTCGTGSWSTCRSFTTAPPAPGVPVLVSPINGDDCLPVAGTADWSDVAGATGYQFQIGTSCGAGTIYTAPGSSYSYSGLSPGVTYYWRARAQNSCGVWGAWSSCRSFTTNPGPLPAPTLILPADGAVGQPTSGTFDWSDVAGAGQYQVQWGTSCGTGPGALAVTSEYAYSGLLEDTTYYWRSRTRNPCGDMGPWTDCFSFTTAGSTPVCQLDPADELNVVIGSFGETGYGYVTITNTGSGTLSGTISADNPIVEQINPSSYSLGAGEFVEIEFVVYYDIDCFTTFNLDFDSECGVLPGTFEVLEISDAMLENIDSLVIESSGVGVPATASFQLINSGCDPKTVDFAITDPGLGFSMAQTSYPLVGLEVVDVVVTYTPAVSGEVTTTLTYTNAQPGTPLPLIGRVVESVYYVATDGDDGGAGTIGDPFLTIQHAVDVAPGGSSIRIMDGTYVEHVLITEGMDIRSHSGDRTACIMQAPPDWRVVSINTATDTVRFTGVTMTGGRPTQGELEGHDLGGALLSVGTPVVLEDCHFIDNAIPLIPIYNSGGAVHVREGAYLRMVGCRVEDSVAPRGGGVVVRSDVGADFYHNVIVHNIADSQVGGLWILPTPASTAPHRLVGNTIAHNTLTTGAGEGLRFEDLTDVELMNNIVAGNVTGGAQVGFYNADLPYMDCNLVYPSTEYFSNMTYDASANVHERPLFCDPDGGDFHLDWWSPALGGSCGQIGALGEGCQISAVPDPDEEYIPATYSLNGAYPNPFNPATKLVYELPRSSTVNLRIYDIRGRLVRTLVSGEMQDPGRHERVWRGQDNQGRSVATGVYFYRLEAGEFTDTKRMMLLK